LCTVSVISGVASYWAMWHVPPRLVTVLFLAHFGVTLRGKPTIQVLCSLRHWMMSTTHSSFDQYCISHKTISRRAAAASSPEVHRECLMGHDIIFSFAPPRNKSWRRHSTVSDFSCVHANINFTRYRQDNQTAEMSGFDKVC